MLKWMFLPIVPSFLMATLLCGCPEPAEDVIAEALVELTDQSSVERILTLEASRVELGLRRTVQTEAAEELEVALPNYTVTIVVDATAATEPGALRYLQFSEGLGTGRTLEIEPGQSDSARLHGRWLYEGLPGVDCGTTSDSFQCVATDRLRLDLLSGDHISVTVSLNAEAVIYGPPEREVNLPQAVLTANLVDLPAEK